MVEVKWAYFTVGELARRAGVAVSTLHFYERKGLIQSVRSSGNQRRFERSVLRRVAVIQVAQLLGLSLSEIAAALDTLPEGRTPDKADWTRLSEQWRGVLDQRIAQLTRLRDGLADCIGCGCLSVENCPIRNPGDQLASGGPGARLLLEG